MKAIRLHPDGGAEALRCEEVPRPIPGPCDVLVRVHAVAVSAAEVTWSATERQARPPSIPGHELSGVIEAVPGKVSGIAVGDAVYGLTDPRRDGAAADYVSVQASELAPKPRTVDHVGAAAMVLAGLTAWQGLFDHARLASGQRVLILGAAGAVGAVAVQLAHWRRAHVIGTACARHRDFLRGLGADEVIDPTSARFDDKGWDADVVLDAVGGNALDRPRRVIRPGGLLVTLDGCAPTGPLALDGVRVISFTVQPNRAQLVELARLVDGGVVAPIVEDVFPLAEAQEAFRRDAEGNTRGKLVLRVVDGDRGAGHGGGRGRAAAPRFAERSFA
jgi:NADPH:quinone reductase-like Zn-dependent oxidoreductase